MENAVESDLIETVQSSYGRCLYNGDLISSFYTTFIGSSAEVKEKFTNTDFEQQNKLLRHGINLIIMYAAGNLAGQSGLKRLQQSHSRHQLNIEPRFYGLWKQSLLKTIARHDRQFNDEVRDAWQIVLDKGISFITQGY